MASPSELSKKISIHDWANALEKNGQCGLANYFRKDRAAGFEAASNLGLPTPHFAVFRPLSRFFEQDQSKGIMSPSDYVRRLQVPELFVSISPISPVLEKYSHHPLMPEEVELFVRERIAPRLYNSYNFVVGEYVENKYGGVIVVQEDGQQVLLEMVEGGASALTRGATPVYRVTKGIFTKHFHYSPSFQDNPDMKTVAYNTINIIPYNEEEDNYPYEARHRKYTPGVYEFCMSESLRPQFIDYSDDVNDTIYKFPIIHE